MNDADKTREQLLEELAGLRQWAAELETLEVERKRTEDTPRKSEQTFRQFIEQSGDGIVLTDEQGTVIEWNRGQEQISGTSREEALGQPIWVVQAWNAPEERDASPPERTGALESMVLQALQEGQAPWLGQLVETNIRHRDGTRRTVQSLVFTIKTNAGHMFGSVMRDITERRQMEEALRESEERYRRLVEILPEGVIIHSKGKIIFVNQAGAQLIGAENPEQLIGMPIIDIVHHDYHQIVADRVRKAFQAGKQAPPIEEKFVRLDGTIIDVEVTAIPFTFKYEPAMITIARDITERKRAEDTVRESEEKYRTILENIEDSFYETDLAGNLAFFNDAMCELLGYPRDKLMGMNNRQYMDDETARTVYKTFNTVYRTGESTKAFGWEMIRKDGTRRYVEASVSLITGPSGEPTGFRGIIRDITERRQAEEAVRLSEHRFRSLIEQTTDAVFCYEYKPPIPTDLPIEEQVKMLYGGILVECNDASARSYGYTHREDVIGKKLIDLFGTTPGSLDEFFTAFVTSGYRTTDAEAREVLSDGTERYYLNNGHGVVENGKLLRIWGTYRDITERKLIEVALKQQALQLVLINEVASQIAAVLDLESVFDKAAHLIQESFNYQHVGLFILDPEQEKLEMRARAGVYSHRFPPDHHLLLGRGMVGWAAQHGKRLLADDVSQEPRFINPFPDEVIRSEVSVPIQVGGEVLGILDVQSRELNAFDENDVMVLETLADQLAIAIQNARLYEQVQHHAGELEQRVAERKQAEEALEQHAVQLVLINEVAGQIAAVLDLESVFDKAAHLIQESFNYQHVGLFIIDPEQEKLVMRARAGIYSHRFPPDHHLPLGRGMVGWVAQHGKRLLADDVSQETRFTNPFPDEVIHSEVSVPIRVAEEVVGVLDVQSRESNAFDENDVIVLETLADQLAIAIQNARLYERVQHHAGELEQRVAERTAELRAAYERLKELDQLKNEFIANVSHELRTPIANLKLYHHMLSLRPDKLESYTETLRREATRLERIVEDLLYVSRLDQKQIVPTPQPIDLNELVARYAADHLSLAEQRQLTLTSSMEPDLPTIQADPVLLERVLSILLTNALNYTPSGGRVEIHTRSRHSAEKQWVGFSIDDTGPGISPDEQPRVFERFFRGRAARDAQKPVAGTGLGLAIAKQIVEEHQGHIELSSTGVPGEGATFTVWLPADHSPNAG